MVALPEFALDALQEHRRAALKGGLVAAPDFRTRAGQYLRKSNFLQHSHESNLIAGGHSVKVVSRRLGHAGVELTLKMYAHLMPDYEAKLAAAADRLYG